MKLTAALIVRNELSRYLEPCIASLLQFCDEVRILDDASDDGFADVGLLDNRVKVLRNPRPMFFEHEGRARNAALQWAMAGNPSHLLAVDADEFVTDGALVRLACGNDAGRGSWSLGLSEVWKADERSLWLREDGGWKAQERGIPILWRVPSPRMRQSGAWQVPDRKLACGREPQAVRRLGRPLDTGASVLHFGWCNEAQRAARYQRYVQHDGGRFHQRAHLDSIMWGDDRVRLRRVDWPAGLDRAAILAGAGKVPEPA